MKKMTVIVLSVMILCFSSVPAWGSEIPAENLTEAMNALNIINGYPDGSLQLDDKLTRAQFAKIMINASMYKNSVSSKSTISPFKDVLYTNWAAPYVSVAVVNDIMTGYPDSSFKPDKNVTLEEAVTVALKLMGYTSDDFGSSWPYGQLSLAANIGLLKNTDVSAGTDISRKDAMEIVYNMLSSNNKSGSLYIKTLGYNMIEDVILLATNEDDSSIGTDKISTSQGIYKISDNLNSGNVGKKGNVILDNNDEIICFIPTSQTVMTYIAYAAIDNDIVVASDNGYTESLGLSSNTKIYYKGEETTVTDLVSNISTGDIVRVANTQKNIDYVVISGNKIEGPVIVSDSGWYTAFNIDSDVVVLRNGVKVSVDDINTNDVLYYSQSLNTLWAYNKKVTGIYESALPNKDQPSSVKISGTEYSIETSNAFNKLSSKGIFNIGDTVTLLLGKDGKIADVISPTTETVSGVVGYLAESGTKEVTNDVGNKYVVNYVKLVTIDGDNLEYEVDKDYSGSLNKIVQVKFSNGLASLSRVSGGNLNGTFDWTNKKLGTLDISSEIIILDVGTVDSHLNPEYIITYPQRINNVKIDSSDILYYDKNENGEINKLILDNVTGDAMKYGIITRADVVDNGMNISSTYNCKINGEDMVLSKKNGAYTNIETGQPAAFDLNNNSIISIKPLSKITSKISNINDVKIKTSDKETYLLSKDVVVYEKTSSSGYKILPISDIIGNNNYNIDVYYDKSEERGGRVRIIIVTEK